MITKVASYEQDAAERRESERQNVDVGSEIERVKWRLSCDQFPREHIVQLILEAADRIAKAHVHNALHDAAETARQEAHAAQPWPKDPHSR